MLRNLQGKIVKFSLFDNSGKWRGIGTGKVMAVDHGERVILSIREHPFFQPQSLVEIFPWKRPGRYQCDVILKVSEDIK